MDCKMLNEIFKQTEKEECRDDILERVTTRGLSGLRNLGNTCYMNSALQVLSATKPLLAYFLSPRSNIMNDIQSRILNEKYKKHEESIEEIGMDIELELDPNDIENEAKASLTYKLKKTLECMWKSNCVVSPITFKKGVDEQLDMFNGMFQHDSQEFLSYLIDKIHEEVKGNSSFDVTDQKVLEYKIMIDNLENLLNDNNTVDKNKMILKKIYELDKKDHQLFLKVKSLSSWISNISNSYSIINDIFSGQSMTSIMCRTCNNTTYKFERFDILTLHLPETVDLKKQEYDIEELLDGYISGDELMGNDKYNCNYCLNKTDAIKSNVIYQQPPVLIIMIKKYQTYNGRTFKSNVKINYNNTLDMKPYMNEHATGNKNYELYATIKHSGGMGGGHYYAYIKNPINNLWFLHDDGDVYHVDNNDPFDCNGYVLLYRLIN